MLTFKRAMGDSLSPLRIHPLRLYLGGQAISVVGTSMQATAQSWVVWKLSHSPAMLGFITLLSTLPFLLLGPWAGVWADRHVTPCPCQPGATPQIWEHLAGILGGDPLYE